MIPLNNSREDFFQSSNYFGKKLKFKDDIYILTVEINETSKILMTCNLKDNAIALYDYSIELSLEEFYNKSFAFKQCKNIEEIYILLENAIKGIVISDKYYYSNTKAESSSTLEINDNILYLILEIPLLTKQIEKVKFQFIGVKRDINNQFEILRNKYKSIVRKVYNKRSSNKDLTKFLDDLKSMIEEEEDIE